MTEKTDVVAAPATDLKNTCHDCRYVSTTKRPKIMEATGFGDQLMFDDVDEIVYHCKAFGPSRGSLPGVAFTALAGTTIGTKPRRSASNGSPSFPLEKDDGETCAAWEAPVPITSSKKAELDTVMSRAFARAGITSERE